jgi:serine/threonine-protein kinase RsbW
MTSTAQAARILTMRVDSRLENVCRVARSARLIGAGAGFDDDAGRAIELCVVEAMNNAIEHAYAGEPGHLVEIGLACAPPTAVRIEVRDRGRTMDWTSVCARADAYAPDFAERGRGVVIIRSLMQDVSYCTVRGWNVLSMVLRR